MSKFQHIRKLWGVIVSEWRTHYRLVFSNEQTHEQRLSLKHVTIQKMFVITVLAAFAIFLLTAFIIAITPLKMYIPGYTKQNDYKLYKQTVAKIDSLEKVIEQNQKYIDNFATLLKDEVPSNAETEEDANAVPVTHTTIRDKKRMAEAEELVEESEMILGRVSETGANSSSTPNIDQARITNITLYPPAVGSVIRLFNLSEKHFGIDISGAGQSPVAAVADGVVIASYYDTKDGYTIIVQHPGNMISSYKRNYKLLRTVGARVKAGDPIALLGHTGATNSGKNYLHFELWYNGFPVNPLEYLVIK